jgi:hypothetical protein
VSLDFSPLAAAVIVFSVCGLIARLAWLVFCYLVHRRDPDALQRVREVGLAYRRTGSDSVIVSIAQLVTAWLSSRSGGRGSPGPP